MEEEFKKIEEYENYEISNLGKAYINIDNKQIHIGYYETEDDAAKARDKYVKEKNLTEFCQLNFPEN